MASYRCRSLIEGLYTLSKLLEALHTLNSPLVVSFRIVSNDSDLDIPILFRGWFRGVGVASVLGGKGIRGVRFVRVPRIEKALGLEIF